MSRESSRGPTLPVARLFPAPAVTTPSSSSTADTDDSDDPFSAPVVASPVKRRQREQAKTLKNMSDEEAWDYEDEDIIEATFAALTSSAYDHFDITLDRDEDLHQMTFVFTCKYDPEHHAVHRRPRSKTSAGII